MGGTGAARRFVLEAIASEQGRRHGQQGAAGAARRRRSSRAAETRRRAARLRGERRRRHSDHPHLARRRSRATATSPSTASSTAPRNYILSRMSQRGRRVRRGAEGGPGQRPGGGRSDVRRRRHRRGPQAHPAHPARLRPAGAVCRHATEGIRHITQADIAFAREFGYVVKSLAIAKVTGELVEAHVYPTMVPNRHLLAKVDGAVQRDRRPWRGARAEHVPGLRCGNDADGDGGVGGPHRASPATACTADATASRRSAARCASCGGRE